MRVFGKRKAGRPRRRRAAFTLVELLVVVAIIAMLIAILLPALKGARAQSKSAVCLSNQRSIGIAIQSYALQNKDAIPRGPEEPIFYYPVQGWDEWATNQVWIGDNGMGIGPTHVVQGLAGVLASDLSDPATLFCPADDTNDPVEELQKIDARSDADAYCSYFYRQRDQTTRDRLDSLGENDLGLAARALLLDANSFGSDPFPERTNHEAALVNIMFLDGHAKTAINEEHVFDLRAEDYAAFPMSTEPRLNRILQAADFAESGNPLKTPELVQP